MKKTLTKMTVALLMLGISHSLVADVPPIQVRIRPGGTNSEGSPMFELNWNASPGSTYRIQARDGLEAGKSWETIDLVTANGTNGSFKVAPDKMEAGAEGVRRQFIQLVAPEPTIHKVEPSVGPTTGGTFYLLGECLNTNGQLRVGSLVLPPNVLEPGKTYSFNLAQMAPGTYDVEWLVNGQVVARKPQLLTISAGPLPFRQGLQEPPSDPPGAPHFTEVTGLDVDIDTLEIQEGGVNTGAHKRPGPQWQAFSGQVVLSEVDLQIPGQGLDFVWARTYRSRTDHFRTMGHRWDHSYNIFVEQSGNGIAVNDGTGRRDVYNPGTNDVYTCHEFFNELTVSGKGLKLTFPWQGFWEFYALDGSPTAGKIARSVDRNGNQITFLYDPAGRLSEIVDSLQRTIRVSYNADGLVQAVTDFAGRSVTYSYYRQGDPNGSPGDLATVTSPVVTNTPTKNDFPQGKTTRYSYSAGFADARENHLLTTITDPKGQVPYRFVYQHNQADLEFLRVTSFQRGTQHQAFHYTYIPQVPTPSNRFAVVKTIANDPNGNVQEMWFNSRNQKIIHRDLAARSIPGQKVSETQNRPTTKVRTTDPDYWETRCEWNLDSLLTKLELPKGNTQELVYESDFNPSASAIKKGDLRVTRGCCADLDRDGILDIVVARFSHDPRFGSAGKGRSIPENSRSGPRQTTSMDGSFVTKAVDARGYVETFTYDARGNLTRHTPPFVPGNESPGASSTTCDYNAFGQLMTITHPANSAGVKPVDTFTYHKTGPQRGYLYEHMADANGLQAGTRFEYDDVGNVTAQTDPRGYTRRFHNNQLNQVVLFEDAPICDPCGPTLGVPTRAFYYDANDNLVRVEQSNEDETGKAISANPTWTAFAQYDDLNRARLIAHELTHVVQQGSSQVRSNQFTYDGLDNVVLHQLPEAVSGADVNNVIQSEFDTRNLLYRETRAPGTALRSGRQFDYDANGNVERWNTDPYVETAQQPITTCAYDGLDRKILVTDPMGNTETFRYDANGNLVGQRSDGETNDVAGSAGNIRLSETVYEYDGRGRCVRSRELFFNPSTGQAISDGQGVTSFAYAPNGQLTSETDDNGNSTRYNYDTLNRLSSMTDARSNMVVCTYDLNDNILTTTETSKSDLGTDESFSLQSTYDPLNRLTSRADNVGNTERYQYDSRGNCVSVVNENGNETRFTYDGLNRVVDTLPYQGLAASGITINTSHVEYQNDRKISVTDQHGNTTTYLYDSLDRVYRTRSADGTSHTVQFDSRNNVVRSTDAKGTDVLLIYDQNDRCIRKDITPGPLVSPQTTFELFSYDGLSRLVHASNNVSMVEFTYDSMDNIEKMKQDCIAAFASYDGVGNTLSLTYHGGSVVSYSRDALNRVTGVSYSPNAASRPVSLGTYGYEGGERLGRIARPNNINTRVMWDGALGTPNAPGDFGWKQARSVRHARAGGGPTLDERSLAYDASQNKVQSSLAAPFVPGGSVVSALFSYDTQHRLTRATHLRNGVVESDNNYGLNALGMRTNVTRMGAVETYTMDPTLPEPADWQMSQYTSSPLGSHVYDENGNLVMLNTGGPGTIFQYDYANRLVHVDRTVGPGLVPIASFTYDPLGRRISKTTYPPAPSAPLTVQFLYGPDDDCDGYLEERISGVTQQTIVYPQGPEVAGVILVQNGQPIYQLCDDLGNVVALASAPGEILERYEYDDFGYPRFLTPEGQPLVDSQGLPVTKSPAGNSFLFHGKYWESELELYFTKGWPCRYEGPRLDTTLARIHGDPHVDEKDGTRWDFTRRGNGFGNPWSERNPQAGAPKKSFASKLGGVAKGVASLKKEEGGRHTPFHNKYRPSARTSFAVLLGDTVDDDCDGLDEWMISGGDCDDTDDSVTSSLMNFDHQVITAREAGSGLATGRRQYQPLLVRKRIDKASPLLMKSAPLGGAIAYKRIDKGMSTAREAGSGIATGRRQYQPLIIRKRIDKASPLLMKSISGREAGSGIATGRRQYQPLIIRKRIDKASPLLMKSISAREAGSGLATGRRQYQPILIRKRIDKMVPL